MILSLKHGNNYVKTLLGQKTLTQRINLPAHMKVGKVEAIVPKQASPAWWIADNPKNGTPLVVTNPREYIAETFQAWTGALYPSLIYKTMKDDGFVQAKICIVDYQHIELGDMSEQDARDEGRESVTEYIQLWNDINPKTEFAFHMSVKIWRIRYTLTPQVKDAVYAVGRDAILEAAGVVPEVEKMQS